MDFAETLAAAQKGDADSFVEVYGSVYRELYRIAYYTLKTKADINKAVNAAAESCMSHCGECKNRHGFRAYAVKLLCEQIIACCREYRNSKTPAEPTGDGLRQQFLRLTDAERLTAAIWVICGYNQKQLSVVTGLDEKTVSEKLEAAQNKLEKSVIVF